MHLQNAAGVFFAVVIIGMIAILMYMLMKGYRVVELALLPHRQTIKTELIARANTGDALADACEAFFKTAPVQVIWRSSLIVAIITAMISTSALLVLDAFPTKPHYYSFFAFFIIVVVYMCTYQERQYFNHHILQIVDIDIPAAST